MIEALTHGFDKC